MFAVVGISGKQYKVALGDEVVVDHINADVGATMEYPSMLVADGTSVTLGKDATTVMVKTTVLSHGQGEKMHVRRFTAKSRHRRHIGFRPMTTTLKIEAIGTHKATPAKPQSAKTEKASEA